jgi:uncharacterized protein (DUF885 family)
MPTPFEISDRLTEDYSDLSPISATTYGISGRDDRWDDFSPDGEQARHEVRVAARAELAGHLDHPDPVERFAAKVMDSYLETLDRRFDTGHWKRDLNHSYSPFQRARDTFDLVDMDGAQAWVNIERRLSTFGQMLEGYRQSLQLGLDEGLTAARRQVESVAEQIEAVAGPDSRFADFPLLASKHGVDPDAIATALDEARKACSDLADWLRSEYVPHAVAEDAVGRERYQEGADHFLGMDLDPDETYEWGWGELRRLRDEMKRTAALIDPKKTVLEVMDMLDTDPERSAPSGQPFVDFVQEIQDTAVEQLGGVHFDVPDQIKKVTVNMAPPGGSLGAWYHGPSEDFSRPGSIWYALGERERIPFWQEVATAYHEGFPGHHLQVGYAVMEREKLSRFHRLFIWYSGSGEGWALYAERLMEELGFFENPEYRMGLLSSQLFRATRVVVDIGTQLEKRIPSGAPLYEGSLWDYDKAVDYIEKVAINPRDVAVSEVKRYLGWVAQAISYKVGEREILDMRRQAMARDGQRFDRKDFHRRMLEAGAIRLDHLREVML